MSSSLADVLRSKGNSTPNSTDDSSRGSVSGKHLGTLRREGIVPSSSSQRMISNNFQSQCGSKLRIRQHSSFTNLNVMERSQWVALGEGWYQSSPPHSGSTSRCGLHSVIESVNNQCFSCMYIPRSNASYDAVVGSNPEYDLDLAIKMYSKESGESNSSYLIFAMKSPEDY